MTDVVYIARCPDHGLHGERDECFECGGPVEKVPVEKVPMVPAGKLEQLQVALDEKEKERVRQAIKATSQRWDCPSAEVLIFAGKTQEGMKGQLAEYIDLPKGDKHGHGPENG